MLNITEDMFGSINPDRAEDLEIISEYHSEIPEPLDLCKDAQVIHAPIDDEPAKDVTSTPRIKAHSQLSDDCAVIADCEAGLDTNSCLRPSMDSLHATDYRSVKGGCRAITAVSFPDRQMVINTEENATTIDIGSGAVVTASNIAPLGVGGQSLQLPHATSLAVQAAKSIPSGLVQQTREKFEKTPLLPDRPT